MGKYYMGIDTGTQGVRVGICQKDGKMLFSKEKKWDTMYPKSGWAEQKPDVWWQSITELFAEIANTLSVDVVSSIESVCVCATSSTVFPVEKDGTPLMDAIMWMDTRAKEEIEIINKTGHPVLDYCGKEVSVEWMTPKTLWIKRNKRDIYDKAYKIVEQLDWLNFKLSGEYVASMCNATCKWNYAKSMGGFDDDFFTQIGLEDYKEKWNTDVLRIGDVVGTIRPELAEQYGFSPDMKIVQGGIDAHMAMFGLNVIKPGKLGIILGTSFVHLSLKKERPDMTGIWGPYDSAVIDDMWLMEGGQVSAAGLINWFRNTFHIDGTADNPYAVLMEALQKTPIGADGVTVLDFFQGNRTPYKDANAKGVIYGLTNKHTWEHIYRAVLESISFGNYNIIKNYEDQGYIVDSMTVCGGVTKDKGWIQMIADISGKPLIINTDTQAGVLGCCVTAAKGAGAYKDFYEAADAMVKEDTVVQPNQEAHEAYKPYFEKYLKLYQALKSFMAEN